MKKILVVEDDSTLLKALTEKFTLENFSVSYAEDGQEGLGVALSTHPDIILLDILMPKMDGMSMLEKLREDEWGKDVPVIMLTNLNPDDIIVSQVIRDHPAYYLIKSNAKIDDILSKVKEVAGIE